MWLPTQAQVNAATRNVASAVGGAILMLGLSAKIDPATVQNLIGATGTLINDLVILIGLLGPLASGFIAAHSASDINQAKAVAATGAMVVTTPEIAAATPHDPNIVSKADVRVVAKK